MNPQQLEQLLLREQSGELTEKQRRALAAELAADPAAGRLRAELRGLAAALPSAPAPAPGAAGKIAARLRPPNQPAVFRPAWKPALAFAAALALLLGVRAYRGQPGAGETAAPAIITAAAAEDEAWTDPLDAEFTELESLLVAIDSTAGLDLTEL